MSGKCIVCDRATSGRQSKPKIKCSECNVEFHGECVKLTQQDIDYFKAENEPWRCPPCQKNRRASLRATDIVGVSNEDVMTYLKEMTEDLKRHTDKQLKSLESELGKSVENCHAKISDLIATVEKQSATLIEYEKLFDSMRQENVDLRLKVKHLECQLDDADQYSRINTLEINGIPESNQEDVTEIVKTIGAALQVPVQAEDIDACHRLGPKQEGRRRGIIVKFVRRQTKEEMLRKRKIKRNLNTSDLGFSSGPADIVYMNESLSPARRKVLNAARQLKKDQNYAFVWVKNGKIFLRKEEGSRAIILTNMDDVTKLQK